MSREHNARYLNNKLEEIGKMRNYQFMNKDKEYESYNDESN